MLNWVAPLPVERGERTLETSAGGSQRSNHSPWFSFAQSSSTWAIRDAAERALAAKKVCGGPVVRQDGVGEDAPRPDKSGVGPVKAGVGCKGVRVHNRPELMERAALL